MEIICNYCSYSCPANVGWYKNCWTNQTKLEGQEKNVQRMMRGIK